MFPLHRSSLPRSQYGWLRAPESLGYHVNHFEATHHEFTHKISFFSTGISLKKLAHLREMGYQKLDPRNLNLPHPFELVRVGLRRSPLCTPVNRDPLNYAKQKTERLASWNLDVNIFLYIYLKIIAYYCIIWYNMWHYRSYYVDTHIVILYIYIHHSQPGTKKDVGSLRITMVL